MDTLRQKLIASILDGNRSLANNIIDDFASIHGYESSVSQLLEPVLCEIGDMWLKEDGVTLAQGYVAGIIADDVLSKVFANSHSRSSENKILLLYGDCSPSMRDFGSNEHITRGEGINCCEILMGREKYRELRKERVFFC